MLTRSKSREDADIRPFTDQDIEPYLERYQEHLIAINTIVINSGAKLEGNMFYFHEKVPTLSVPDPARRHKRANFAFFAKAGNNLLEIGFNAGHSALLALAANEHLEYFGIDLGVHPYTVPCYQYLESVFGSRINLVIGDSREELPRIRDYKEFDLVHIDGGHGLDVAEVDLCNVLDRASPGTRLLFDDVNYLPLRVLCDHYLLAGNLIEMRPAIWKGNEQAIFRVTSPNA